MRRWPVPPTHRQPQQHRAFLLSQPVAPSLSTSFRHRRLRQSNYAVLGILRDIVHFTLVCPGHGEHYARSDVACHRGMASVMPGVIVRPHCVRQLLFVGEGSCVAPVCGGCRRQHTLAALHAALRGGQLSIAAFSDHRAHSAYSQRPMQSSQWKSPVQYPTVDQCQRSTFRWSQLSSLDKL